jgi:hypothetical protein
LSDQPLADSTATMGPGDSKMMQVTSSSVVSAEYRPNDVPLIRGYKTETLIALDKLFD